MSLKKPLGISLTAVVCAALLTACGGGGGDGDNHQNTPPAATSDMDGFYAGSANGRDLVVISLDDGRVYALYTGAANGVILTRGTGSNGSYTSTVMKDLNFGSGTTGTGQISASYVPKKSVNGTVSYTTAGYPNGSFTLTYDKSYENKPSLGAIAGSYQGAGAASNGRPLDLGALTVSGIGTLTAKSPTGVNCSTSGTVTPRSKGDVYDVTFTSTGSDCVFPDVKLSGVGIYDAEDGYLVAIAHTDDLSKAVMVLAEKNN